MLEGFVHITTADFIPLNLKLIATNPAFGLWLTVLDNHVILILTGSEEFVERD